MSRKHPIVAVTGSSGAGTTTVKIAFDHIFTREGIKSVFVEGDCFHRYNRQELKEAVAAADANGTTLSHFGPEGNLLDKLEELFIEYGESGTGQTRHYVHNEAEAEQYGEAPGTFTDWEGVPRGTDLLFYEGLHGGGVVDDVDIAGGVGAFQRPTAGSCEQADVENGVVADEVVSGALR